ncbi:putative Protein disabled [Hypsibius exemplaris]|uniref:PID domain-containing protein n=1 Tax=Hypsibius exemplaris TaxID=2072580 RepID=A0A9X6NK24_HYPEX|nr:putative Protein disabled [Hypsibius exemplaris]
MAVGSETPKQFGNAAAAPIKERLDNNFGSDNDDAAQVPKQQQEAVVMTKKPATSQLSASLANHDAATAAPTSPDASSSSPASPPVQAGKQKSGLFTRVRKVPFNKGNSQDDDFKYQGEGIQFKGKLIGIKDVESARGDEMCKAAMLELKNGLKTKKEHKIRIGIAVSLSGLTIKDEKGTIAMHQHAVARISYIWRDPSDQRSFGYVYGTPDSGHRFAAVKVADKSADALVGAIHELFQVAYRLKQREIETAKKGGQDDAAATEAAIARRKMSPRRSRTTDTRRPICLIWRMSSSGIQQMDSMNTQAEQAWADFGGDDHASNASSSSDPWGRGNSPQSVRTITPDPFDTLVQYGGQLPNTVSAAPPAVVPRQSVPIPNFSAQPVYATQHSQQSWGSVPATPPNSLFNPMAQQMQQTTFSINAFSSLADAGSNPFGSFNSSSFSSPPVDIFGMSSVTTSPAPENSFSVFDPPPPAPVPVKEEKKMIDPFSTGPELFGDILKFGAPRSEKTTKNHFPQPLKPTIGDLRGEPITITPAATTVDPFFVTPSAMGLSVSVSPPNHSSITSSLDYAHSPAQMQHNLVRRVSTTSGNFNMGAGGVSPPVLPPRPLGHSNSVGTFAAGALPPPPAAPRRTTQGTPPALGFSGGATANPFGSMATSSHLAPASSDPFASDPFFAAAR